MRVRARTYLTHGRIHAKVVAHTRDGFPSIKASKTARAICHPSGRRATEPRHVRLSVLRANRIGVHLGFFGFFLWGLGCFCAPSVVQAEIVLTSVHVLIDVNGPVVIDDAYVQLAIGIYVKGYVVGGGQHLVARRVDRVPTLQS